MTVAKVTIAGWGLPTSRNGILVESCVEIGLFCRSWRKREQITQAALADSAGVGVRFVSEFERGKPTCEIGKVIKLCKTIGIDFYAAKR